MNSKLKSNPRIHVQKYKRTNAYGMFLLKCTLKLYIEKKSVGKITASAISPYLQCLIGYVRLYQEDNWVGKTAKIFNYDGEASEVQICELPFYDQEKDIPRNFNGKGPEF